MREADRPILNNRARPRGAEVLPKQVFAENVGHSFRLVSDLTALCRKEEPPPMIVHNEQIE